MAVPADLFSWPLLAVSVVLTVMGLVTWTGLNRAIVLRAWPSPTTHVAPLYLGDGRRQYGPPSAGLSP